MRSVTCPDCGAQVEIPVVTVGDESVVVYCKNCLWRDLDILYGRRGLVVWGGGVAEMACWTCVPPGSGLQAALDANGPYGGPLMLQKGTYTGDITIDATKNTNAVIYGAGVDSTVLTGSVTITSPNVVMDNLTVRGTGKPYGIYIQRSGGVARTNFKRVNVGGSVSSADAPTGPGLWLDGAIVMTCDQCSFSFNGASGLYVDTTVANDSTNVNTFRDCTFNQNAGYGAELVFGSSVASMMGFRFAGGNMQDNVNGELFAQNNTLLHIDGVDFERTIGTGSYFLDIRNSNPVTVENSNFHAAASATGKLFCIFQSVQCGVLRYNRIDGFDAGPRAIFDESSVQCVAYGNVTNADGAGRVINNRGSMWGTA